MASTLSPQVFAILSDLVRDRLGIEYGPRDLVLFSEKITARARDAGFESVLDYYYFLRYDPAASVELEALADALVVGETYFFRELAPARAAVEEFLVPAVARKGRARVWSAACATGEEPLSIAMLLAEAGIADRCEILGTDVSARAISGAREGSYGGRSLRALPPACPLPGWTPSLLAVLRASMMQNGNRAVVSPALLAKISYRQLNLLDTKAIADLGTFDLVFCRNVLIYFADATVVRVVTSLANALDAQGALIIGASESLLRFGTALSCTERAGSFFYERGVT